MLSLHTSHTQANILNGLFFLIEAQISGFYSLKEEQKSRILDLFKVRNKYSINLENNNGHSSHHFHAAYNKA
jgi:hypothetical protein